jgi:hypothetical protein
MALAERASSPFELADWKADANKPKLIFFNPVEHP